MRWLIVWTLGGLDRLLFVPAVPGRRLCPSCAFVRIVVRQSSCRSSGQCKSHDRVIHFSENSLTKTSITIQEKYMHIISC